MKLKLFFIFLLFVHIAKSQTTSLVSVGADGKLLYTLDSKGNKIPDFSGVGYRNSEEPIPLVSVVKIVYPVAGDNLQNVQEAINEVATYPLDANGFRGAILFKSGLYEMSDTIKISASGIVLRGEGNATEFKGTKTAQYSLFYFSGNAGLQYISSTKKAITNSYVPFGSNKFSVATGHSFNVGDQVMVHRIPKQTWIDLLNMAQWGWTYPSYDIYFERKITAVNGNELTIDAPVVDIMDATYAPGEVLKFTSERIENCGIENMKITSTYVSETDENHCWEAITFYNITNAWAKNIEVQYVGYAAVHIEDGASFITVDSCKFLDPKSTLDGGRRYAFNVDGQRSLVQNCFTRNGRHDYVNGSRTPGPVVFYNCIATQQNADIGPHHRWSTGILFDNVVGDGNMAVQNRANSGSGHGWAGGQTMFWNCDGYRLVIQDPEWDYTNWAIGCQFVDITNVGDLTTEPYGFVESSGTHIAAIPSLFNMQLNERMIDHKRPQQIAFPPIPLKSLDSLDFYPGATSSSGLPVSYVSSDTLVAKIINGKIHIIALGTCVITASQQGNLYYQPASNVDQQLIVNGEKGAQILLFPSPAKNNITVNYFNKNGDVVKIKIYNTDGKLVKSQRQNNTNTTVNQSAFVEISALASGSYFMRLEIGNEIQTSQFSIVR